MGQQTWQKWATRRTSSWSREQLSPSWSGLSSSHFLPSSAFSSSRWTAVKGGRRWMLRQKWLKFNKMNMKKIVSYGYEMDNPRIYLCDMHTVHCTGDLRRSGRVPLWRGKPTRTNQPVIQREPTRTSEWSNENQWEPTKTNENQPVYTSDPTRTNKNRRKLTRTNQCTAVIQREPTKTIKNQQVITDQPHSWVIGRNPISDGCSTI